MRQRASGEDCSGGTGRAGARGAERAEGRGDGRAPRPGRPARGQPVLALPRRRARRLSARARDLPAPDGQRRPARPRAPGCASWSSTRRWRSGARGWTRSTATTSTSTRASTATCATSTTRSRAASASIARSTRCARSSPTRPARCCSRPRAVLPGDRPSLRLVLHEGQPVDHRGPRALPEDLPRDRGRRGVREPRRGAERARRRHGDARRRALAAPAPAALRDLPRERARAALLAHAPARAARCRSAGSRGCCRARTSARRSGRPPTAAGGSGRPRRSSGCA